MTDTKTETLKRKWDPDEALSALLNAEGCAIKAEGLNFSLEKMAGSQMVQRSVKIEGEEVTIPEYIEWLGEKERAFREMYEMAGGSQAARLKLGEIGTISYAGEVPAVPRANQEPSYPSLPA